MLPSSYTLAKLKSHYLMLASFVICEKEAKQLTHFFCDLFYFADSISIRLLRALQNCKKKNLYNVHMYTNP